MEKSTCLTLLESALYSHFYQTDVIHYLGCHRLLKWSWTQYHFQQANINFIRVHLPASFLSDILTHYLLIRNILNTASILLQSKIYHKPLSKKTSFIFRNWRPNHGFYFDRKYGFYARIVSTRNKLVVYFSIFSQWLICFSSTRLKSCLRWNFSVTIQRKMKNIYVMLITIRPTGMAFLFEVNQFLVVLWAKLHVFRHLHEPLFHMFTQVFKKLDLISEPCFLKLEHLDFCYIYNF